MSNSANSPTRPLPELRNAGAEYWNGASRRMLLVPLCRACGKTFWHPRPRCPYCAADQVEWKQSRGNGVVHTFTIVRQSPDPFFKTRVPYAVAMVQLDDGPLLMSNIEGCSAEAVKIGMRVSVAFEPATDNIAVPIFRPEPDQR